MKKVVLMVGVALLVYVAAYAAAPGANCHVEKLGDTLTVDSQYTGAWELLDSVILVKDDSCYTVYTISGQAELDPLDRLYIGFIDGGGAPGATSTAVDTFVFYPDYGQRSKSVVSFKAIYIDSLQSQTDANDTIYYMAACGGSGPGEKVMLLDVIVEAKILDDNAGGGVY